MYLGYLSSNLKYGSLAFMFHLDTMSLFKFRFKKIKLAHEELDKEFEKSVDTGSSLAESSSMTEKVGEDKPTTRFQPVSQVNESVNRRVQNKFDIGKYLKEKMSGNLQNPMTLVQIQRNQVAIFFLVG